MEYKNTVSRRSILQKSVFASTVLTSIGSITNSVSATDTSPSDDSVSPTSRMPGGGGGVPIIDTTSEGEYTSHTMEKAEAAEAELAIGSAVTASPYTNPPAPVFVNWATHVTDAVGIKKIDDLEVKVTIKDYLSYNDQWRFLDPYASMEDAPQEEGFVDAFGVSVGYMGVGFGVSFSVDGDQQSIDRQEKEITYNFGQVVDAESHESGSNTGWLKFNVNNPVYSNVDYPKCTVRVEVSGTFNYNAPCPGWYCHGEKNTLSCSETFAIDFSN
ncbi:hypothetical protein [Natrinema salaciae]|uniref:Uncharacterized protein n=1 Tax=Natrinema salaciae TaxID=1186196 RepID=A0A1H9LH15_9EURY|nr:hypothetical protein [Natrinema salaciae]SER10781.1 hypothetical protein SAMN04489841_2967 [Natrinema salaciae]